MLYKLPIPEIPESAPFKNCKLGRKQYADILTKVISRNPGCVFAIDGKWGSGKTTFVKMWEKDLIRQNYHVLSFNVWEHDFITDPIIGLVGQFRNMADGDGAKATFAKVAAAAGKIASGMFPALVKGVAKRCLGEDTVDVLEAAADTMADSFKKTIDEYVEQCQSMVEFRNALENLVESTMQEGKPLVFIVDELDRCNPRYAVKVLERVKHLFNVPNIVFVLAIDKKQLCNAICGYYGSENLDAPEYLKRFIDIEYKLPEPDVEKFTAYLYEIFGFDEFLKSEMRLKYFKRDEDKEEFLKMAHIIFEHMHLTLRQMEKIGAHIRLAIQTFQDNQCVYPGLFLLLMCFRSLDRSFYDSLAQRELTVQEVLDRIEKILPKNIFVETEYNKYTVYRHSVWTVARFLVSYNQNANGLESEKLIQKIKTKDATKQSYELLVKPTVIPPQDLEEATISYCENSYSNERVGPLSYLIQHIELLTSFR